MPTVHKTTVVLFGEVLADIFPDRQVLGGAPFNVARHLRAFGLHPLLITRVGQDQLRDELLAAMKRFDMDTRGVQSDPVHPTGQVTVSIDQQGHNFDIQPLQAYDFIDAKAACSEALAVSPLMMYFGTLAQRHETSRQALEALLQRIDALKYLDINLREPWFDAATVERSLANADIVKMNEDELATISAQFNLAGSTPQAQGLALQRRFGLKGLQVTCGADGAWQLNTDGRLLQAQGGSAQGAIVDTVGAGDGFAAVCIAGQLLDWPPQLILDRANIFAATICTLRGAIPPDEGFYSPFLREWHL
ncbi:carbohydrate kinase family protein [Desulfobulbus alkaliphilus]|uniref:carbohydrate kinase family protein n=1 Tax=Desulfobulbus alkaliphilus TaxID=869814 RepID=UPI001963C928|nr:carbohydrate kinase [Desulfobulbus alkaliphilus]MBM9537591.1 carbohydrate kinase [Desulfobulbus alkaliphilus]